MVFLDIREGMFNRFYQQMYILLQRYVFVRAMTLSCVHCYTCLYATFRIMLAPKHSPHLD